jgi:hypothetical protein
MPGRSAARSHLVETGAFHPVVADVMPLDEAGRAHAPAWVRAHDLGRRRSHPLPSMPLWRTSSAIGRRMYDGSGLGVLRRPLRPPRAPPGDCRLGIESEA